MGNGVMGAPTMVMGFVMTVLIVAALVAGVAWLVRPSQEMDGRPGTAVRSISWRRGTPGAKWNGTSTSSAATTSKALTGSASSVTFANPDPTGWREQHGDVPPARPGSILHAR